ncbi:hydroxymethylbilane synthase [Humitalea sp. 24SJ18S-53]|uniref:hydroxymethylbilane synthase n=1 Tax=Humitalea sp. 24SJ18S-53 TaxID=3422307 RepID=UPI003D66818F
MIAFPAGMQHGLAAPARPLRAPIGGAMVRPHHPNLPLRIGTRGSPLALWQTRDFLGMITRFCPVLRDARAFVEHTILTSGDRIQDRPLAEIGGKGLFAKEIHEALLDRRIDFAVHSLKDLETDLPSGIALACTLKREDPRDALILGPGIETPCDPAHPFACLPYGSSVATSSVRRQSQLLHARPDLRMTLMRGNVQTRLAKIHDGGAAATLLAFAGLKRLGLAQEADIVLDEQAMLPAACQGIVGVTVREDDLALRELLAAIEDPEARAVSQAERALLAALDGSCRTPIGGRAQALPGGRLALVGLVARADGSFLLRRDIEGDQVDASALGYALGDSLRRDAPADIFG